jgi:hypothetical protein
MIKNQLVIYRTFAMQHIVCSLNENVSVQVSPFTTSQMVHCNFPFELKNSTVTIQPYKNTHNNSLSEFVYDSIELLIKIPQIHWKSNYILYKSQSVLICSANIINDSKISYKTKDIKLIFRSLDHKYKKEKEQLNDIPTFDTSNYQEYAIKEYLDENFVLDEHYYIQLWSKSIDMYEFVQVDIDKHRPKLLNSFINLIVPELMLPGNLEVVHRQDSGDILHLGTLNIKLYLKGQKLQIMFPNNKSISVENKIQTSSHSFFITKSHHKLHSKIKRNYSHPLMIEFITCQKVKSSNKPAREQDGWFIWEHKVSSSTDTFDLEFDT